MEPSRIERGGSSALSADGIASNSPMNARHTLLLVVVLLSVGAQSWLRRTALEHRIATTVYEHTYYLPPTGALHLLALGQREALADMLWARSLVYLGEEAVRNLAAEHVFHYARSVVSLDPYFSRAYSTYALAANSRPGLTEDETTERIRQSLAFLEEGVTMLPNDGSLAWDTGATYAYTYAPRIKDLSAYREAKRRGLEHMQAATLRGFGPPWAGIANAATLVKLGQTEQAAAHLQELYAITSDPEVRADIETKLADLRSEAFMESLRQVSIELRRKHQQDFPYVTETMYLLLGERPLMVRSALLAAHFDPAFTSASHDARNEND